MKILNFQATSDIIGRRIQVSWELVPEAEETLADAPPVLLRRKERDFDFPPHVPGSDPYLVYDSNAFPAGPPASVTELPGWEVVEEGQRTAWSVISVAHPLGGRLVETSRLTVGTTYGADGVPLRQRVEVLDLGGAPGALVPRRTYYYQLFGASLPTGGEGALRATATATEAYGLNKYLYESLPEIYRRHDVVARQPGPGSDTVPESSVRGGQLRRFLDLFGLSLDSLRSTAEGLRDLRTLDEVDARFLPLLAKWIGWDLSFDVDVPLQRNELKAATRVYRSVGTVPGLRALVSHYSGWFTQVAEFAQHLLRANHAPLRNLFATTEAGGIWRGIDDAAPVLGFGAGNDTATGSGSLPATLVGAAAEPFALRPGMELRLSLNGEPAVGVRFSGADFADIQAATTAELAAVLGAALPELTARVAPGGQLELVSNTVGPESSLRVVASPTSLVTLEAAPGGRPSVLRDTQQRLHLFYETREPPTLESRSALAASATALSSQGAEVSAGAEVPRLHHKVLVDGGWRDAHPVSLPSHVPRTSPAAAELTDGRLWVAFVENPDTPGSRPRMVLGRARPASPARLLGQRRAPFSLLPGTRLRLAGSFGAETFLVEETDYANVARATAAEVAAAMNAQLTHVATAAQPDGSLRLETVAVGDSAWLAVDLAGSNTGRALGFGPRNASARGHWEERLEWGVPQEVGVPSAGFHADPFALAEPEGTVRLFWAAHQQGQWRLVSARWDERVWFATAAGVSVRRGGGAFTHLGVAQGLPSADVRGVAVDARGMVWLATAAGVGMRRSDGTTSTFDTSGGLPSNDVRAIALAPDGAAWFATAGGVGLLREDGSSASFTTAEGIPSNDVRALAVADDGTVWLATAAGLGARRPGGPWQSYGAAQGLPSLDVRALAIAPDRAVWAGTAAGLVVSEAQGTFQTYTTADGLPSNEVRALAVDAEGAVWIGTSHGLGVRRPWGAFETLTSSEVRAVAVGPDGTVWAATGAGVAVRRPDNTFTTLTTAEGLANNDVRAVHGPWSARRELASGGGGNREPAAVRDGSGRLWLVWSQRQGVGTAEDTWLLRYRLFDPASLTWGPERELTSLSLAARATDREPGAVALAGGGIRVYFRSDRSGAVRLWSLSADASEAVAAPVLLTDGPEADTAPVPLALADGSTWLFHRSDRSIPLSQVGSAPLVPSASGIQARRTGLPGSVRLSDEGSLRRYAGSTSIVLSDLARARQRRRWGDLLAYTPQKPAAEAPLTDDELYTRGTLGLYVSRTSHGSPLTLEESERLRQLLLRFLPINARAVLILAPSITVETLYPPGADIQERYEDNHPFIDTYTGLRDETSAALPGWTMILSNTLTHVSVDPGEPGTWRRRSFFFPPE